MTENQKQRLAQAIRETVKDLIREKAYLPHLQKPERIAECEAHLAKLATMLGL